jgi:hypothetical protein
VNMQNNQEVTAEKEVQCLVWTVSKRHGHKDRNNILLPDDNTNRQTSKQNNKEDERLNG